MRNDTRARLWLQAGCWLYLVSIAWSPPSLAEPHPPPLPPAKAWFLEFGFPMIAVGTSIGVGFLASRLGWRRRKRETAEPPRWLWPLASVVVFIGGIPLWLFLWTILAIAFAGRTM